MAATAYRLSPGYHLVPSGEGWLVYRPDGLFARLTVKAEMTATVADLLAGEGSREARPRTDEIEALLDALLAQGIVTPTAEGRREVKGQTESAKPCQVMVEGEGPIASRLVDVLLDGGLEARTVQVVDVESGAPGSSILEQEGPLPDVVVCCAGWLPDARFSARDAWCAERGVAWHGVYLEGCRFHLGPFWLPDDPRTVRYADARARRLAADAHPEGLEAYWRYLDAGRQVPAPPPPDPAEAAIVAGALGADILAWAERRKFPSHGHQLALDRTSGEWRRHPVLPVPRGLMTEVVV